MKKLALTLTGIAMVFTLIQCSTPQVETPDPKVTACKQSCDTAYDECVKKAGKNEGKKTACATAKEKCYTDCETKK